MGTGTVYHSIGSADLGWNGTEAARQSRWGQTSTVVGLFIALSAAPGGSASRTFTFRVNGGATAVTCVVSGASTTASDVTHTAALVADDLICLQEVGANTPAASDCRIGVLFDHDSDDVSCFPLLAAAASAPRWLDPFNPVVWNLTEGNAVNIVGIAGAVTTFDIDLSAAPGVGNSRTYYLVKNGVNQDGGGGTPDTRIAIADAATTGTWTGTVSCASGDTVYLESALAGDPAAATFRGYVLFTSSVPGRTFVAFSSTNSNLYDSVDTFVGCAETNNTTAGWETEANSDLVCPGALYSLGLVVHIEEGPGTGNSYLATVRRGGADTTAAVTLADAAVLATTNTVVALSAGDRFCLRVTPDSTPTVTGVHWALGLSETNDDGGIGTGPGRPGYPAWQAGPTMVASSGG